MFDHRLWSHAYGARRPLLIAAALGALLGACGRTAPRDFASDGGARLDGRFAVPDGAPRLDGWTPWDGQPADGPVGVRDARPPLRDAGPRPDAQCNPGCPELCAMAANRCGLISSAACLSACAGLTQAQRSCLVGVYCAPGIADPCVAAVQCMSPTPSRPDLAITAMSASANGTTVRYTVSACNLGGAPAPGFFVDLYYDRPGAPTIADYGDQYEQHPGLPAGACDTLTFTRTGTPSGSYTSWAQIDADANIDEANEANNIAGPVQVSVGGTPTVGADLWIESFSHSLLSPRRVRYSAHVCNAGTATAAGTYVYFYYDRPSAPGIGQLGDRSRSVPPLSPGACATRTATRTGTPPGTYTSWAQVDATNQVPETDEANNTAGPITVQVGNTSLPDLLFTAFIVNAQGSVVDHTAEVCNKGAAAAGTFRIDVYYSRATAPPDAPGDDFIVVPALAAGDCTKVTLSRPGTPDGTYAAWARVDVGDQVQEAQEQNNVTGPVTVVVGPPLSDCAATCTFATSCGLFTAAESAVCFTWCNGLTVEQRACLDAALKQGDCGALSACNTPPPPPPPPPPGVCPDLCNYLIADCNLLPAAQYWTCIGACQTLPPDRIACAQQARNNQQCMQIVTCLF